MGRFYLIQNSCDSHSLGAWFSDFFALRLSSSFAFRTNVDLSWRLGVTHDALLLRFFKTHFRWYIFLFVSASGSKWFQIYVHFQIHISTKVWNESNELENRYLYGFSDNKAFIHQISFFIVC
jgi:hypothetical protein